MKHKNICTNEGNSKVKQTEGEAIAKTIEELLQSLLCTKKFRIRRSES